MTAAYKLGRECTITIGSNELKLAREVTVEFGGTEIDVTSRNSNGYKQVVLGLKELTISGTALYDSADSAVSSLVSAYNAGTALTVTVSDPTLSYTGQWIVTALSTPQPLDDVMTIDFTLKPTLTTAA